MLLSKALQLLNHLACPFNFIITYLIIVVDTTKYSLGDIVCNLDLHEHGTLNTNMCIYTEYCYIFLNNENKYKQNSWASGVISLNKSIYRNLGTVFRLIRYKFQTIDLQQLLGNKCKAKLYMKPALTTQWNVSLAPKAYPFHFKQLFICGEHTL